ncbi:WD repeat-containing protein 6-like isoform X2 [Limulus polyphemus]|uniref:tRNA (34-2'-O)-methyltransferase regulator WDR6 n=1 Tax=Limulus polyphemus TaxID=6850 RepID=A0ABM1TK61_LIMPO|nr:WD repeat-containing protein 6-like isoform X2 [Limulus polyphemus]
MCERKGFLVRSSFLGTHVTALTFHENVLLVGEGPNILVYENTSWKCFYKMKVFKAANIHGIRNCSCDNDFKLPFVAVYGSKFLSVLKLSAEDSLEIIQGQHKFEDWILDVCWLRNKNIGSPSEEQRFLAIVLAHNTVLLWNWRESRIQHKIECEVKCILYSASFLGNVWEKLILAGGTVFKEVVLWPPSGTLNENKRISPFHRLTGHQGVIFSIHYNHKKHLLCSVSDDRSIRLWRFILSTSCNSNIDSPQNEFSLSQWRSGKFELLHTLSAHQARVWSAWILTSYIISVGEDSSLCIWDMSGNLLRKDKCHNGGSVWSLTVNEEETLAVTGGNDSGVTVWYLNELLSSLQVTSTKLPQKGYDDFPRNVALISSMQKHSILVSTDAGVLCTYCPNTDQWDVIHQEISFRSYSSLAVSSCGFWVGWGNITGKCLIFSCSDEDRLSLKKELQLHDGKVHSVLWVSETPRLILTCGPSGQLCLSQIEKDFLPMILYKLFLPRCKQHWTSAGKYVSQFSLLVVGSRDGSVHVYSGLTCMVDHPSDSTGYSQNPTKTFHCIHGKNGVTDIQVQHDILYTSGRDGRVLLYKLGRNTVTRLRTLKTNFISWSTLLQRPLVELPCGGGHRSWDVKLNSETGEMAFACIKKTSILWNQSYLLKTVQSSLVKTSIHGQQIYCILHLCQVCIKTENFNLIATGGEDNTILISRMSYNEATSQANLEVLCRLAGHISSIRGLASCPMTNVANSYLLVSVGGRAQLIVWNLTISHEEDVECKELDHHFLWTVDKPHHKPWQNRTVETIPDALTRYMSVAIFSSHKEGWSTETTLIATSCSDAFLRLFAFCIKKGKITHLKTIPCGVNCMQGVVSMPTPFRCLITTGTDGCLKIWDNNKFLSNIKDSARRLLNENSEKPKMANVESKEDREKINIISKKLYSLNEEEHEPLLTVRLHQSGINAISTYKITETYLMLCTGGDDCSLTIQVVIGGQGSVPRIVSSTSVPSAHAAQISGVSFLNEKYVVSTAVDQQVNLWKINWLREEKTISLELLHSKLTSIPDASHLQAWKYRASDMWTICVCGEGVEIFTFLLTT